MPNFPKGSPEARAFMAKLRAMRGKKNPLTRREAGEVAGMRDTADRMVVRSKKVGAFDRANFEGGRADAYKNVLHHYGPNPDQYVIEGFQPFARRGQSVRRVPTFRSDSLEAAKAEAERIFQQHGVIVAITRMSPRKQNPPQMLVLGNPLTRGESADLLWSARHDLAEAKRQKKKTTASFYGGRAVGKAIAAKLHGPEEAHGPAVKVFGRGYRFQNPGPCPKGIPPWMWADPAFHAEVRAFRRRHGPNKRIEIVKVKIPKGFPKFMSVYGRAPAALYDAPPGSPVGKRIHHFGKRGKHKPWLVSSASRGPKFLAFVGGTFKAKPTWIYD